jgi:hypothetical protein
LQEPMLISDGEPHLRRGSSGHSDTRITADIYGHVSPSVAMAAMQALSSRLSSNGG